MALPWPFAFVLVEQVVSVGMGRVDDTRPASEGTPGLASFHNAPCPAKEAASTWLCTPSPLFPPEQAWLPGRHLSQLCSGWTKAPELPAALPPCLPPKGKARDSQGIQQESGI